MIYRISLRYDLMISSFIFYFYIIVPPFSRKRLFLMASFYESSSSCWNSIEYLIFWSALLGEVTCERAIDGSFSDDIAPLFLKKPSGCEKLFIISIGSYSTVYSLRFNGFMCLILKNFFFKSYFTLSYLCLSLLISYRYSRMFSYSGDFSYRSAS